MRRILTLIACAGAFSTLALAADWSGSLLDVSCYDREYQQAKDMQKAADSCAATGVTSSFALHASGKVYKFDSAGNTKASSAMKNHAERLAPGKTQAGPVSATVKGTETAGTISVESIEIR